MQKNCLLDEEQKGCRKKLRRCKKQLVIHAIITGECKKNTSRHYIYIDYQKSFDSVP